MQAMLLNKTTDLTKNKYPLERVEIQKPTPKEGELLIRVSTCGVCHTELDEIEGRIALTQYPMILGHQVVGVVEELGLQCENFTKGDRVGVAWIYSSCGECKFCKDGNDNLCADFRATGRDANGGYAEYMVVNEKYAYSIPNVFSASQAAPLLCAGAIGYRSLKLTNLKDGQRLGLTGFGASGHLVLKMAKYMFPNSDIYVFARSEKEREFSKELGAVWAGNTEDTPPCKLDAIIDTTPAWKPVVEALKNLNTGGRLIINAIRKEDVDKDYLMNLNYPRDLWMEKEIKSVANISRKDVIEFLELASKIPIKPEIQEYNFEEANNALIDLKQGRIKGAKVLVINQTKI